jgi:dihydrodipicolinate synthase/N-acetylneuraminate lyase
MTFFRDVCGAFPDAQFLHYNLPRPKRVLNGQDYRRLIEAIPNLVATKNTGGGLAAAADLMKHASALQHFFGEANFPHGCRYGECSLLSSFGPMSPHKSKALFEAGCTGQLEKLIALQHEFHDMSVDLFGPLRGEARIDGAYDKMLVRLGGFEAMPLRLLSPYQGFSEEEYQACKQILHEKYPDWLA